MFVGLSYRVGLHRLILNAFFCVGISSSSILHASTPITWSNSNSGNWSVSGNWNPGIVPNGDYDVSIPSGGRTITLDVSASVSSLTVNDLATVITSGNPSFTAGSVTNLGKLVLNGTGSFNISGSFHNTSTSSIFILGTNSVCDVGVLDNTSRIGLLEGSTLNILGGGSGFDSIPHSSSYELYSGSKLNVVNSGVPSDAFANVQSIAGTLMLHDGQVRHWSSLNLTGTFTIDGAGTRVDIDSFVNNGQVSSGIGSVLNLHNQAPITEIPMGAGYAFGGEINVVNSGVSTPALSNLQTNRGELIIFGDQNRNWGPLVNRGYLDFQGGLQQINGNLTNSFECWVSGSNPRVVVNGSLRNDAGGIIYIGLFGADTGKLQVQSFSNSSLVNFFSGGLMSIGTGSPTVSQGLQIMPDGTLTIDIANARSLTDVYFYLAGMPVNLAGTLDMMSLSSGLISENQTIGIILGIQPGGITGSFSSVLGEPYPGGYWQVNYDNLNGNVSVTALTLPEPTSLCLIGLSSFVSLRRHRRAV